MKVATIQLAPTMHDRVGNLQNMVSLAITAAEAGAELIVLPELATTGYSFMSYREALPYAEHLTDEYNPHHPPISMMAMAEVIKKYQVAVAWGTMEIDVGSGSLYNSQVLAYPGNYTKYRKINQWGQDYIWAKSGTQSPPIVSYKGKKVGLLICRDVRDKGPVGSELTDFYEKGDADIVCFSANFGNGGFPAVSWMDFALENSCWLVVSNRYGKELNNDFGQGGICVIDPKGHVHCKGLQWSKDCIVYADIP